MHELGHAYTALAYGWRVKKIELLPFGGVAEVEEYGNKPLKEELVVILAGPFMNMMMIVLTLLALYLSLGTKTFFIQFLEYNLLILLFNLLPIWPLDGGKLAQSLLSYFLPYKQAISVSLFISLISLIGYIILLILLYPLYFSLWIIAIFLLMAQWFEYKQIPYQFFRFMLNKYKESGGKEKRDAASVVSIIISPSQTVQFALEKLYRHKYHYFCLSSPQGEITRIINEEEMLEQYFKHHQPYRAVGEIFR